MNIKTQIYMCLFPQLQQVAKDFGYALTLHGSIVRDLDVVAIPWSEGARTTQSLVEAIQKTLDCSVVPSDDTRPFGRKCWAFLLSDLEHQLYIDLSVVPVIE